MGLSDVIVEMRKEAKEYEVEEYWANTFSSGINQRMADKLNEYADKLEGLLG